LITRRITVTNIWRRFLVTASDVFGIADLELAPRQRLATDSVAIAETITTRRTPVEIFTINDLATHA
jgi:hypothetical protein